MCKRDCPNNLSLREAQMSSHCFKAMEYGLCRYWKQVDKIGLEYDIAIDTE